MEDLSAILKQHGWIASDRTIDVDDVRVYESKYFYPYHWSENLREEHIKPETYSIHHWASTWVKARDLNKVSIIVPCYNQAKFLGCVSIRRSLVENGNGLVHTVVLNMVLGLLRIQRQQQGVGTQ